MKSSYKRIINKIGENKVRLNEPLRNHTYIKIGGPADLFFTANSEADLTLAVRAAIKEQINFIVIGGGSNLLIGDKGFRGLVIKNRADKISFYKIKGKIKNKKISVDNAQVIAESGVVTNLLVRRVIEEELEGLEYFLGIPGTIGGAVYNNSHYQKELIGDVVDRVTVLDKLGNKKTYSQEMMNFDYDYSILHKTGEIILNVAFKLHGGNKKKLWEKAESFAKNRSATQPLNLPSSGCMFKNVKLHQETYGENPTNTSAGYLIDKAGLKGTRVGGIMISEKHANFMVNDGNATAKDVLKLIQITKKEVDKKFSVQLELEIFKIGEFRS